MCKMARVGKYNILRTFVYHPDPIIDPCCFAVDAVGECQELCRCHPDFILCQFIQSLKSILDIRLSQQLLQILFW